MHCSYHYVCNIMYRTRTCVLGSLVRKILFFVQQHSVPGEILHSAARSLPDTFADCNHLRRETRGTANLEGLVSSWQSIVKFRNNIIAVVVILLHYTWSLPIQCWLMFSYKFYSFYLIFKVPQKTIHTWY